jgi:hypothetical protein
MIDVKSVSSHKNKSDKVTNDKKRNKNTQNASKMSR